MKVPILLVSDRGNPIAVTPNVKLSVDGKPWAKAKMIPVNVNNENGKESGWWTLEIASDEMPDEFLLISATGNSAQTWRDIVRPVGGGIEGAALPGLRIVEVTAVPA